MNFVRFEVAARFRAMNRLTQLLLLLTACAMAVALGQRWLPILDISANGRHSLTPETVAYVEGLPTQVEVIASLALGERGSLGASRTRALTELLSRYEELGGKVTLKWVDGYRAQTEYAFADPYRIMVRSNHAVEWVLPEDLWERRDGTDRFLGEKAITSAIAKVCTLAQKRVLLCVNSAKASDTAPMGLSEVCSWLKDNTTQLDVVSALPLKITGYDLVCLWGDADVPSADGLAALQRAINDEATGVWVALDGEPNQATRRFLYYNAVEFAGSRAAIPAEIARTPASEIILNSWGEVSFARVAFTQGQKILTKGYWWNLSARSDSLDSDIQSILKLPDAKTESLALAIRRTGSTGVAPARIVIFGGIDWMQNDAMNFPGNRALTQGTLDWISHAAILSSIPPRETAVRQLALSGRQLWKIGVGFSVCVLVLMLWGGIRFLVKPR